MATWRYIKGSEEDFQGAPDWATVVSGDASSRYYLEECKIGKRFLSAQSRTGGAILSLPFDNEIIAQRERVTSVNDDRLARDMGIDVVNHPSHYTQGDVECIDAIKAATVGKNGIEAVCVANVIKYLWRYEEKNGVQDCHKARWYLDRLLKELNGVKK